MNNVYLKGTGDYTPDATPEPTDEQIQRAVKEHAVAVTYNATSEFKAMLHGALVEYFIYGTTDGLDELANASAVDLLERECIS